MRLDPQERGGGAQHGSRVVANSHGVLKSRHAGNGFCDHPGRVGENEQPCIRRQFANQAHIIEHDRDGSHGHGETAWPGGLLAEHTVLEWHLLIDYPRFHQPYTKGKYDEIGTLNSLAGIGCPLDLKICAIFQPGLTRQTHQV